LATSAQLQSIERRIVMTIAVAAFLLTLAMFAGALLAPRNTLAIVDPLVRLLRPSASAHDIERFHNMARKFGHFMLPAAAFALMVLGPLRKRPLIALALCALFAMLDEFLQAYTPGRSGSFLDVILDTSGALFAYFVYRASVLWSCAQSPLAPVRRASSRH
jgi:VanZ family protein